VTLVAGILRVRSTPPDVCTLLDVQHEAPDRTTFTNIFFLRMVNHKQAQIETCKPQEGSCYPNIDGLALKSAAGQTKTVVLFQ
jgi:hypothetical protein